MDDIYHLRSLTTRILSLRSSQSETDTPQQWVGFVSEPNGRGTGTLVISCLLTLVLCVWSALHLNVPGRNDSFQKSIWRNIRWITAGIYCPEMVVFAAWRQWSSACMLQRSIAELQTLQRDDGSSEKKPVQPEWTMTHSFFACTGGFAIELESVHNARREDLVREDIPPRRVTITAKGMLLLAHQGRLPRVERAQITDKSKANGLAKATVLVQGTWMVVQVLGRLAARLPITLLEINTIAHVMCAFALYLFWWHKPLLPEEPIILHEEDLGSLASFMYLSSELSGAATKDKLRSQTFIKTLFAQLKVYSTTPELENLCFRTDTCDQTGWNEALKAKADQSYGQLLCLDERKNNDSDDSEFLIQSIQIRHVSEICLQEIENRRAKETGMAFFERRPRIASQSERRETRFGEEEPMRWTLLRRALREHDLFSDRLWMKHHIDDGLCMHLRTEQLLIEHAPNWPSNDLLRNVNGLAVGMVLWCANFCYGSFHAAAWNDNFPTDIERWLWRGSSVYISFCGGLWIVLNFIVARFNRLDTFWEKWMDGKKGPVQTFVLGLTVFICGATLLLARVYLVVESFASIRKLPAEAYDTPQWSSIFPHF